MWGAPQRTLHQAFAPAVEGAATAAAAATGAALGPGAGGTSSIFPAFFLLSAARVTFLIRAAAATESSPSTSSLLSTSLRNELANDLVSTVTFGKRRLSPRRRRLSI
jgi:hypothetical protein